MVGKIYPNELQLNKANSSDAELMFFDMNLSITSGKVLLKLMIKEDDFNFEIVNFPFLNGDLPSLFVLQECILMLMSSTKETYD